MSFILDSIKKAERERKLGQQVPSISVEYKGEGFARDGNDWNHWWLLSIGIILTALIVWTATYFFINKDHQYEKQLSEVKSFNKELIAKEDNSQAEESKALTRNIEMVPVKNVHKSDLKAVKIINEDEDFLVKEAKSISNSQQSILAERVEPVISKQVENPPQTSQISKPLYEIKPPAENEINDASKKQELVAIYSDLAEAEIKHHDEEILNELNAPHDDFDDDLVEIRNASFVDSNINHTEETLLQSEPQAHVTHKTAVSTGVPSFGELPYEIQEQIPDFNVSVHMFHEDPSQRRIRINGGMYTEGKYLQQDLALVEITRYGAVFDYQGHLFRLNVR